MSGVDENGKADGERSRKGLKNLDETNLVGMEGLGSYSSEGHVKREVTRSDLGFLRILWLDGGATVRSKGKHRLLALM